MNQASRKIAAGMGLMLGLAEMTHGTATGCQVTGFFHTLGERALQVYNHR